MDFKSLWFCESIRFFGNLFRTLLALLFDTDVKLFMPRKFYAELRSVMNWPLLVELPVNGFLPPRFFPGVPNFQPSAAD